jgi:hypothetical protein
MTRHITYESVIARKTSFIEECGKAEKGSVQHAAYNFWANHSIPAGIATLTHDEKTEIGDAMCHAFIEGAAFRLTRGENDGD